MTNDNMIERVTRALLRERLLKLGHLPGPALDAAINAEWPEFTPFARAALKAMREPTEAMAAEAMIPAMARDGERVWRTMIDVALAEEDSASFR